MFKKFLIILVSAVLVIVIGLLLLDPILNPEYKNKDECKSFGTLELLCGLQNPEDFAEIPNENAVIVSQFSGLAELSQGEIKPGILSRMNLDTKEIEDYQIRFELDNNLGIGEEGCEPYDGLYPHGIDIYQNISVEDESFSPFLKEAHLLAVVNHELIDRIEFFLFFSDQVVFADSNDRELFWVGCVKGPKDSTYFNDVVISDENGSFYATHQYDKDWEFLKLFIFNIFRWDTGYVYEWNKELGYSILNNSDGAWPNGIEMIGDTVYVSFRMNGSISAINNGGKRKDFKFRSYLDGGSDNIIAKNEELWIAVQDTNFGGLTCMEPDQIQCATPFSVIRTDADLNVIEELNFGDVSFGGLSVVYPHNNQLFLGSYKSDRIAIYNIND